MQTRKYPLILILLLLLLAGTGFRSPQGAFAQTTPEDDDGLTLRVTQVDTSDFPQVTVYVTAVDQQGNPAGIDPARIQLAENEQVIPQDQIQGMGEVDHLTTLLVVDVSGSMQVSGKLDAAKAAALEFIAQLRPVDQVGLVSFSDTITYVQPVTADHQAVVDAVNSLQARGDTAMYDALDMAVGILEPVPGRKAVIALTDGLDNRSVFSPDQVLEKIGPSGLSISTIGLGNPENDGTEDITALDETALTFLAENAGGLYGYASDAEGLSVLYQSYATALKSEYVLTYTSPADLRDGVNRALQVRLTAPSGAAIDVEEAFVYNPGGLLPEVSEPAPWPLFAAMLGGLIVLLFLPGLVGRILPRGNAQPKKRPSTKPAIKLKD